MPSKKSNRGGGNSSNNNGGNRPRPCRHGVNCQHENCRFWHPPKPSDPQPTPVAHVNNPNNHPSDIHSNSNNIETPNHNHAPSPNQQVKQKQRQQPQQKLSNPNLTYHDNDKIGSNTQFVNDNMECQTQTNNGSNENSKNTHQLKRPPHHDNMDQTQPTATTFVVSPEPNSNRMNGNHSDHHHRNHLAQLVSQLQQVHEQTLERVQASALAIQTLQGEQTRLRDATTQTQTLLEQISAQLDRDMAVAAENGRKKLPHPQGGAQDENASQPQQTQQLQNELDMVRQLRAQENAQLQASVVKARAERDEAVERAHALKEELKQSETLVQELLQEKEMHSESLAKEEKTEYAPPVNQQGDDNNVWPPPPVQTTAASADMQNSASSLIVVSDEVLIVNNENETKNQHGATTAIQSGNMAGAQGSLSQPPQKSPPARKKKEKPMSMQELKEAYIPSLKQKNKSSQPQSEKDEDSKTLKAKPTAGHKTLPEDKDKGNGRVEAKQKRSDTSPSLPPNSEDFLSMMQFGPVSAPQKQLPQPALGGENGNDRNAKQQDSRLVEPQSRESLEQKKGQQNPVDQRVATSTTVAAGVTTTFAVDAESQLDNVETRARDPAVSRKQPPKRPPTKEVTSDLPEYIYPQASTNHNSSIVQTQQTLIFEWLKDPERADQARNLIRQECLLGNSVRELAELERKKDSALRGLSDGEEALSEIERKRVSFELEYAKTLKKHEELRKDINKEVSLLFGRRRNWMNHMGDLIKTGKNSAERDEQLKVALKNNPDLEKDVEEFEELVASKPLDKLDLDEELEKMEMEKAAMSNNKSGSNNKNNSVKRFLNPKTQSKIGTKRVLAKKAIKIRENLDKLPADKAEAEGSLRLLRSDLTAAEGRIAECQGEVAIQVHQTMSQKLDLRLADWGKKDSMDASKDSSNTSLHVVLPLADPQNQNPRDENFFVHSLLEILFLAFQQGRTAKPQQDKYVTDLLGKLISQKRATFQQDSKELTMAKVAELFHEAIDSMAGRKFHEFNLDDTRTESGLTLLMVSALRNDIKTAQLCIELGANTNATSPDGYSALLFADLFNFEKMKALLASSTNYVHPRQQSEMWRKVFTAGFVPENSIDWQKTFEIAEKAALPAESIMTDESAFRLEESDESRMTILSPIERQQRDFVFFDASLSNEFDASSMRRAVLLSQNTYDWLLDNNSDCRKEFCRFLDGLKPDGIRHEDSSMRVECSRRSVVGMKKTYEVLAVPFRDGHEESVVMFTPFVSSFVEGVADVGIIVWAIAPDCKASLYKTLIQSTEFLRHKVEDDDRFPDHDPEVFELGKDVHLLDLESTSIFTSKPMGLYIVDVDANEDQKLWISSFTPAKRIVHYEQQLNRMVFTETEGEAEHHQKLLSHEKVGLSTSIFGGAGTGKTLLMTRKISSVSPLRKVLVVSRLPRLVSEIRSAVEQKRDTSHVTFTTYEDLLHRLTNNVQPTNLLDQQSFPAFARVRYGSVNEGNSLSPSFLDDFCGSFLELNERKKMKNNQLEPLTLWTAFRNIKSSSQCSVTKKPLTWEEFSSLPGSFGLRADQRRVAYDLFLRYQDWLNADGFKWDEEDRLLYILQHGPSPFADSKYLSWENRASQRGESDLLEEDGKTPLSPFFYDFVFADEAQDFTELDLALFLRMSSGVRSIFLGSDPAQSVELGIRMLDSTLNDVFHKAIEGRKQAQVQNVLQEITMKANHRTHAQNLALATAVRKMLAQFGVPMTRENALITGPLPEGLKLEKLSGISDPNFFAGGNIVFLVPDEFANNIKSELSALKVKNLVYGVKEAKGLEFGSVALIGFFSYIEHLGSAEVWKDSLRSLTSSEGESSSKQKGGRYDLLMSHPEILDQQMLFYTALTRAKEHLYIVEFECNAWAINHKIKSRRNRAVPLADFAFRQFKDQGLLKIVQKIDEGAVEMTAQEHKKNGVQLVTLALNLHQTGANPAIVREKLLEAAGHFEPSMGNDKELFDQCQKHIEAIELKQSLMNQAKREFYDKQLATYRFKGRLREILDFEQRCSQFFGMCVGDPFLVCEIKGLRKLLGDMFAGSPYEARFLNICEAVRPHERV